MAKKPRLEPGALYVLVTSVVHAAERYEPGTLLLGNDPVCVSRPELFARHDLGFREILKVREELDRIEREEDLRRRAEAAPPAPPQQPQRVICTKPLVNPGVGPVAVGAIFRRTDQLVEQMPAHFALIED